MRHLASIITLPNNMIGVFDSGLGGLTTLKELQKILPEYSYIYLGDTANAPYGKRSKQRVRELTEAGVLFLFQKGATVVLIACNTASTDSLRFLQEKYPEKKILGVLIPAVETALASSRYGNIGMIGTEHTVDSGNFEKEIQKKSPAFFRPTEKDSRNMRFQKTPTLSSVAAPLLVPLIEEGWTDKPETKSILKKYLISLKSHHVDTLILGCTHYPILEKLISRKMGKNCTIINSGKSQAEKFQKYLKNHPEISQKLLTNEKTNTQFFTTDCPEKFLNFGKKFLGRPLSSVKKTEI